jgi:ADP-heptose:LPS heptosyltransferase
MPVAQWEALVEGLATEGIGIVQAGKLRDRYIRGAYSLLGLTTPRTMIGMLRRFDAIVTSDSFIMHAAHLCSVPAVVLWGPTDHRVVGYDGNIHLQAEIRCGLASGCIGSLRPNVYQTECPEGLLHCMNTLSAERIRGAVISILDRGNAEGSARGGPVGA